MGEVHYIILRMDRIEKLENILSAATNLSTPSPQPPHRPAMVDSHTQTLSTGDIVITKVFFPEGQQPGSQVTLSLGSRTLTAQSIAGLNSAEFS